MAVGDDGQRVNEYLVVLDCFGSSLGRGLMAEQLAAIRDAWLLQRIGIDETIRLTDAKHLEILDRYSAKLAESGAIAAESLERRFVDAAKAYADDNGIGVRAWRTVGVPSELLRRARIQTRAQTRRRCRIAS